MVEDGNGRLAPDEQAAIDLSPVAAEQDLGTIALEQSSYREAEGYNRVKHLDWVRSITMYAFISIFALTVIASLVAAIWFDKEYPNIKDLIQALLPAETGLIGSAVGFYFGSEIGRQRERD